MATSVLQSRIIEVATKAIKDSKTPNEFKHASVIVYKGRIIVIGLNNQSKTHTKSTNVKYPQIHSELSAFVKLKNKTGLDFSRCELYNIRVGRSGRTLLSYPCINCQKLLIAAKFKRVYYTNNWGVFEEFRY